ncbi:hypothetical protein BUALT_Bualt14G0016000 [Buddleja alternifolia]|uniref:Retrotransposon gag domain-containing protein n=1 Tax=Buddleja alternifolia TaxID=168488 RepID=A0AAV6WR24_9LAMI|nr:hypothetical protein BUALT_Bualt14G0016000 [Buddleja alternifolia]
MKEELKRKFLPNNYRQDAFLKFHNFKQKELFVAEYTAEFENLMMRYKVLEPEEQIIACYLGGLKSKIYCPNCKIIALVEEDIDAETNDPSESIEEETRENEEITYEDHAQAEFAYNRSSSQTTGKSPFEVLYGMNPTSPLDLVPLPITNQYSGDGENHANFDNVNVADPSPYSGQEVELDSRTSLSQPGENETEESLVMLNLPKWIPLSGEFYRESVLVFPPNFSLHIFPVSKTEPKQNHKWVEGESEQRYKGKLAPQQEHKVRCGAAHTGVASPGNDSEMRRVSSTNARAAASKLACRDEVGFVHPTQFAALNEEVHTSPSLADEISEQSFWHSEHKLGISTAVVVPLYNAAKHVFMDAYKQYRMLRDSHVQKDESLDDKGLMCSTSSLNIVESEVMKHSRALVLLSCDFGTAWNSRKLIVSMKLLLPMFVDELLLSALVLSYSPKSERAWSHRRWVIKMIAGKCPHLQEIVERESELVKTIAENSKMNYRAWNHRCWLVSYMSDSQVLRELQNSRDWAGLHVADNSCFHYRAVSFKIFVSNNACVLNNLRLLLQMVENVQNNNDRDALLGAEFHKMWKCRNYFSSGDGCMTGGARLGRDVDKALHRKRGLDFGGICFMKALWLHRRFLSLLWMKHLASDEVCDVSMFINDELTLVHSCTIIPDDDFGDYQAQATCSATYIMWLAKQMPKTFGVELQKNSHCEALKALMNDVGKGWLWDSVTTSCRSVQ